MSSATSRPCEHSLVSWKKKKKSIHLKKLYTLVTVNLRDMPLFMFTENDFVPN